jgi:D-alanyl-D-alanine carboxypeptidase
MGWFKVMGMAARGLARRRFARLTGGALAGSALLLGLLPATASAQIGSARYSAVVMEPRTGNLLFANNPDELRHPASLTKMMTLYMLFDAMRAGLIGLDSHLVMSSTAASKPPSKLGIPPGRAISVEQGIYALVTKSANDVASLMGETLAGGDEYRFAQMMTLRARAIGMTNTTFRNASGLPDIEQVTTARDMATLGRRLQQDFPEHYHYFGTRQIQVGNISLRSHNRMLDSYEGVDGIKTGYVDASGFNIVTSAKRDNIRLIVAVFGGNSWTERDRHAAVLLDQAFAQMGVNGTGRELVASASSRVAMVAAATAASTSVVTAGRRGRIPSFVAQAEAAPLPRGGQARLVAATARVVPARGSAQVTARAGRPVPAQATASARTRGAAVAAATPRPGRAMVRQVIEQGDGGPARAARPAARAPARVATPAVTPRKPRH